MAAVEPQLSTQAIEQAVIQAASAARTVRLLAEYLTAHPHALTDGTSGTVPVLRRLAQALYSAGARRIAVRDPTCVECGRMARSKKRVGDGWMCSTCQSKIRYPCAGCGQLRRAYARHPAGVLCEVCVRHRRNAEGDQAVTSRIVDAIRSRHAPRLTVAAMAAMVRKVAPRPVDRRLLAEHVDPICLPAGEAPLPLTRLIIALTAVKAFGLPSLVCGDCAKPVGGDGHASLKVIQCGQCARRCPECGRPWRRLYASICNRCRLDRHRRRGDCTCCSRRDRVLDDRGMCRTCRDRTARRCLDCGASATPLHHVERGEVCDRCALRRDLDQFLPEQTTPPCNGSARRSSPPSPTRPAPG
ncbi:MAG: hypothetical protein J2P15_08695 [Micromonosporaceae bacterium]|nr:hypothetical protein [Micromonosporaceae bacterium]